MSVRGTDFIVYVDEYGNTEVSVAEGSVYVESKHDGSNVLLEFGEKVLVNMDESVSEMSYFVDEDWAEFTDNDYESLPDYYEGLGEDEVIENIESYDPQIEDEGEVAAGEEIVEDDPNTNVVDEDQSEEEGSSIVFWVIVIVFLLGIVFIIKTIINLLKKATKR
jgi:hypothetical protein